MGGGAHGRQRRKAGRAARRWRRSTRAAAAGPTDVGDVKVPKASGADARTVAEVWAQRTALKEKPVTVRGKVVKFNAGIMGKNWLHLRDGSGAAGKDNDITITTSDEAAVGDVVAREGHRPRRQGLRRRLRVPGHHRGREAVRSRARSPGAAFDGLRTSRSRDSAARPARRAAPVFLRPAAV